MVLEDGQVAFGLPSEADVFLKKGIEQPYDNASRINPREWQVLLPPAATWLSIAGNTIYKICRSDDIEEVGTRNMKYDRWGRRRRVWSKQLWDQWKARLQSLARDQKIDIWCRGFATEAARKMADIETELSN